MANDAQDDPDLMDPDAYENREDMDGVQRDMNEADRMDTSGFEDDEDTERPL
ncbi:MAG TPA: hypothetical protein VHD60_00700 [Candidatus Saccharimonadales bacterium]|nr:hypothetical protein [Candidatus Saccharimonadales bacterium]